MSSSTRTSLEPRPSPFATLRSQQRNRFLASAVLAIAAVGNASPGIARVEPNAVPPGTPQVTRPEPTPPSRRPDALVVRMRERSARRMAAAAAMTRALPDLAVKSVAPVYPAGDSTTMTVDGKGLAGVYRVTLAAPTDLTAAIRALAADPAVEWAEPVFTYGIAVLTNDPYFGTSGAWGQPYQDLWGLYDIGAPTAWSTTNGAGIPVAVVDTGSDATHPDLASRLLQNAADPPNGIDDDGNGFVDDTAGWDFANGDSNPTDDHGHGTHVAGTIAAVGNNGSGIVGVAWGAGILTVKGFDASGQGDNDELAAAIVYAVQRGARVINMSWGGEGFSQVIEDAFEAAAAAGVTLVAAAGNNGGDAGRFYPCSERRVICVGASTPTLGRAWFSNYGGTLDLLAPGGADFGDPSAPNILSLKAAGTFPGYTVGDQLVRFNGTSMASPHTAGAAALVLAAVPAIGSQPPLLRAEQVRQALRRAAAPAFASGWDPDSGYGRLSVAAAITDAQGGRGAARILTHRSELGVGGGMVRGTASCTGLASWQLAIGEGPVPTSWTTFASGAAAIVDGNFGTWNPGNLGEGNHVIRLLVTCAGGRVYEDRLEVLLDRVSLITPYGTEGVRSGDLVPITGTAAIPDMLSFQVRYSNPWKPGGDTWHTEGITLAGGGIGPVMEGPLGTWDTSVVTRPTRFLLQVAVLRPGGIEEYSEPNRFLVVDPDLHPGWPKPFPMPLQLQYTNIEDNATVADLDGDGIPEMVVVGGDQVHALRADGSEAPGWPRMLPLSHVTGRSPAIADLDGDGPPEVVVGSNDWGVTIFEHDGQLRRAPDGFFGWWIALGDVIGDGRKEIVVTGDRIPFVTVFDRHGDQVVPASLPCQIPAPPGTVPDVSLPSPPALGDLDGDGKDDIVVLQRNERLGLYACHGDGTALPGFPIDLGPTSFSYGITAPVLGDIDADGRLDIVVSSDGCDTWAFDRNANALPGFPWHPPFQVIRCSPTALTQLDGNFGLEVVLGGRVDSDPGIPGLPAPSVGSGVAWVLRRGAQVVSGWPRFYEWGYAVNGPVVLDVDADGGRDLLFDGGSVWFPVNAAHADGTPMEGFPRPTVTGSHMQVVNVSAVADFDGDGLLEQFWIGNQKVQDVDGNFSGPMYLWDIPAARRRSAWDWTMLRHDAAHTGAQLGDPTCTLATCAPSMPFADGFERGTTAAWITGP